MKIVWLFSEDAMGVNPPPLKKCLKTLTPQTNSCISPLKLISRIYELEKPDVFIKTTIYLFKNWQSSCDGVVSSKRKTDIK